MSSTESVWAVGLLGVLLAAYFAFRRQRRRTEDYHQARVVKRRLPNWVAATERALLYGLMLLVGATIFVAFALLHRFVVPSQHIAGATLVFAAIGAILLAAPWGALLANLVSWSVPTLRQANESAMLGSSVSFASANRGLLRFCVVSAPAGIVVLAVGMIAPWSR